MFESFTCAMETIFIPCHSIENIKNRLKGTVAYTYNKPSLHLLKDVDIVYRSLKLQIQKLFHFRKRRLLKLCPMNYHSHISPKFKMIRTLEQNVV